MVKKNLDIRRAIENANVPYWQVAAKIGITDSTFSRWLRFELPESKKRMIYKAIDSLRKDRVVNG